VPFGNVIADLTEPVLTAIVNSAYPHGNPIPADPSKYQPATPFSSLTQLATTAATNSAPKTSSTAALTTADATPSEKKKPATLEEKPNPLTNLVRNSAKAVPQYGIAEVTAAASTPDPVATVDKPTKDKPQETAQDEQTASFGKDAEAPTS
jgi:hypothetical protein